MLGEGREFLGGAQKPGVDEIEQRPQIAEAVLDRRTRHGDTGIGLQQLHRPGLLGARILDCLRLVKNGEAPRHRLQHARSLQCAVGGEDEVDAGQLPDRQYAHLIRRQHRRMHDERNEARGETRDLGRPVADQRGRNQENARLALLILLLVL
jgi:hypothetical protein